MALGDDCMNHPRSEGGSAQKRDWMCWAVLGPLPVLPGGPELISFSPICPGQIGPPGGFSPVRTERFGEQKLPGATLRMF